VGRVFHARGVRYLTTIVLPAAMPVIFAALRLAWGTAFVVAIAAEFNSAKDGLGSLIFRSWQVFSVERMYVGLIVTGVIGWLSFLIFDEVERRIMPWNSDRNLR
jgi:NitT/TauT family transport system permease protein